MESLHADHEADEFVEMDSGERISSTQTPGSPTPQLPYIRDTKDTIVSCSSDSKDALEEHARQLYSYLANCRIRKEQFKSQ